MLKKCMWLLSLALLLDLAIFGGTGRAQSPVKDTTAKVYIRSHTFCLPIALTDADRANLQEVRLYVRAAAGAAWTFKEAVPPTKTQLEYEVAQDGEYAFALVAIPKGGGGLPTDTSQLRPQVVVVVDTHPPEIALQIVEDTVRGDCVDCKVRDANLDAARLRVEYQIDGNTWRPLIALPDRSTLYRLPTGLPHETIVRATAIDKAGNAMTRSVPVARATARTGPTNHAAGLHAAAKPSHSTESGSAPPHRQLINDTHVAMEYQIEQQGVSGVGKVEVWMTRNEGATWQRLCEDSHPRSPVEFDLPGEGDNYGISLVVMNGNGAGGAPPAKGDKPDYRLEVDLTRPVAQLKTASPSADGGKLDINWVATDKNLGPTPVDLYYATQRQGPWSLIALGVKNDGSYQWAVPPELRQRLFIGLVVTDLAGNQTRCESGQPVVMDMARPKARILVATPAKRHQLPPTKD